MYRQDFDSLGDREKKAVAGHVQEIHRTLKAQHTSRIVRVRK